MLAGWFSRVAITNTADVGHQHPIQLFQLSDCMLGIFFKPCITVVQLVNRLCHTTNTHARKQNC